MEKFKILICDDEEKFVSMMNKILSDILSELNAAGIISEINDVDFYQAYDAKQALQILEKEEIDILLLDIDMPRITGLDLASYLMEKKIEPKLIFVTNQDMLVYDSLRYKPFAFIRKSCFEIELSDVLQRALKEISSQRKFFVVKEGAKLTKLRISEIIYFESMGNYVSLYSDDQTYIVRDTMQNLEREFDGHGFIRIHKGFLVNSKQIKSLSGDALTLNNDIILPLGRSYKEQARPEIIRSFRE